MRSTIRRALSLFIASLLLHAQDRTHLDCTVAGARTPLSPGHCLLDAGNVNHKVARKLFFGVGIWAVNDVGFAVPYANAGCCRSRLKAHAGMASGLRQRFVEGRVI